MARNLGMHFYRTDAITHQQAREAAQRFIDAAFRNSHKPQPRFTIPVEADNDDVLLMDYITQREMSDGT